MNGSSDPINELGDLMAALCEGELDAGRAARIEELVGQSTEARQLFLHYLLLDGELYWDHASAAVVGIARHAHDKRGHGTRFPRPGLPRTLAMVLTAVAAAVLVVLVGSIPGPDDGPSAPASDYVARLTASADAEWAGPGPPADRDRLAADRTLHLRRGLAEITFDRGARVILQGPATFQVTTARSGQLDAGCLAASVPGEAAGFTIRTPGAVIVDRGTEFGVVVEEDGPSEIHVFVGAVEVLPVATAASGEARRLSAGQAVRVPPAAPGAAAAMVEIALRERRFVRRLPELASPAGSVARLRSLVAGEPNLIHHYTFEGATRGEQCRDRRGDLNLAEVVMSVGRGGGNLDFAAAGFDATTRAVRPFRAEMEGNSNGVALQSETRFLPPAELTVELLLCFDGLTGLREGEVVAAVATRDRRSCGFFAAAVADGQLVVLMDPEARWCQSDLVLEAGQWHYVAATFRAESDRTRVNVFAANLSRDERALRHVASDQMVPGVPAISRLGIGKAFDRSTAHAYPWAGALDEVALYDAVLARETLDRHLEALLGPPPSTKTSNP